MSQQTNYTTNGDDTYTAQPIVDSIKVWQSQGNQCGVWQIIAIPKFIDLLVEYTKTEGTR